LIENPWKRRDQPAQRKPFQKRFDRELLEKVRSKPENGERL